MYTFFSVIWFITLIAFIVYWRKKCNAKENFGPDSSEYQSISKTKRIIGIVCLIMFVGAAVTQPEKAPEQQKSQVTAEKQESKEATKEVEVKVPTFHVTPEVFQQRYNEYLHSKAGQLGASGKLDLGAPKIESGSVNNTVAYASNELNLAINQTIDKASGEIKEMMITSTFAGKDGETTRASLAVAIVSYNAAIYAIDPNADHEKIQNGLGLDQKVTEWIKESNTTNNNIEYFKKPIQGVGLCFGASAK